jgi:hypothetical protein
MKHLHLFENYNRTEDTRDSWTVHITDKKEKYKRLVNIGDTVELNVSEGVYVHPIYDSQATPVDGTYTLTKVNLDDTDVVKSGNDTRQFWDFDNGDDWQYNHIDDMKGSFEETPPVTLELKGGTYYSVDGHHRIVSAKELGLTNILAFVIEVDVLSYPRSF